MGMSTIVALAFSHIGAPPETAYSQKAVDGPALAFIKSGDLFTLRPPTLDERCSRLYRLNLPTSIDRQPKIRTYAIESKAGCSEGGIAAQPFRWFLTPEGISWSDDHPGEGVWLLRVDFSNLDHYSAPDRRLRKSDLYTVGAYADPWELREINRFFWDWVEPWVSSDEVGAELRKKGLQRVGEGAHVTASRIVTFHIQPLGESRLRIFILFRGQMHVYEGHGWSVKTPDGKTKWKEQWEKTETFLAGFDGQFVPFGTGKSYFFVTQSGHVYTATDPGKGLRESNRVRLPGDNSVRAIIRDIDGDRAFCFGPAPEGNGRWFCLELAPDAKPRFLDRNAIRAAADCKEPMRTTYELATWLKGQGLVK
jgi:hypothetical protein